jgi:hypothetical protein
VAGNGSADFLGSADVAGWVRFAANQEEHQQVAEIFGRSGYVFEWLPATMENWQSEFLQLLTFGVLTASFVHRGSHESRDGDDEMKASRSMQGKPYRVAFTGSAVFRDGVTK